MKPFIGIKKIWYGDVITEAVTKTTLKTWLGTATEVKNSHQDTWQYTEDDPTYTDYINELTGKIYYRDVTQNGAKTITFTMGEFTFDDKARMLSVVVHDNLDGDSLFVGHVGVLVPTTDGYLFVEKLDFFLFFL